MYLCPQILYQAQDLSRLALYYHYVLLTPKLISGLGFIAFGPLILLLCRSDAAVNQGKARQRQ